MPESPSGSSSVTEPGVAVSSSDDFKSHSPSLGDINQLPRQFGRYRIEACLGRGGMGAVFRAHDSQLDRTVALKVPFLGGDGDEIRQRFYREGRAAANLHHPNICPVFDVGEIGSLPYLTMAFIEGRSLAKVLESGHCFTPQHAAALVRKLANAMQEAHLRGVIHRDLKPGNVLLRSNGEPVIMDFGLARRHDDRGSEGLTRQGEVLGTLEYMPPEQLDGDNASVGPSADIYALGIVLYEVLTGRRPFSGNATKILAAILLKPPPRPGEVRPGLPRELDEICLRAMAREPSARFASMAEFAAALTEYLRSARQDAAAPIVPSIEAQATPRPSASTQPIKATSVASGSAGRGRIGRSADDTPSQLVAEPVTAKNSAKRKRQSRRRKQVEKRSKFGVVLVVSAAAVSIVIAVVAVFAFRPGKEPLTVREGHSDTNNPPAAPRESSAKLRNSQTPTRKLEQAPAYSEPSRATGTTANTKAPAKPASRTQPPASAAIQARIQPDKVDFAVGEKRQITVEFERHGYQGPLTLKWNDVRGVRILPAGPLTVKPGDPNPVLSLWMTSPPPAGSRLEITATPAADSGQSPITVPLAVHTTFGPCLRIIEISNRADAAIGAMAFTPDANLALIGTSSKPSSVAATPAKPDSAIQIWDLARGEPLPPLTGHSRPLSVLVVSGDGKTALSAGADETVCLWDLTRGRRESQSPKQSLQVQAAAISPDGKRALVLYPGMVVKVDLQKFHSTGQPIKTAQLLGNDHPDAIHAVAVSGDQKGLAGGADGKLFLLDWTEKARPKPLTGLKEMVRCAAFSPKAGVAAAGGGGILQLGKLRPGRENAVCLWDTTTGSVKWRADELTSPVTCIAFSSDGARLASGGTDGELRVWNVADGKLVATFQGHAGPILALAFTADGKHLLSGSSDKTMRTWVLP
jgi:serine/threonine protein kinase